MGDLAGKVALITGAGNGVGRGMALACAGAGASVVLCVRHLAKGDEVAATIAERGGEALVVGCDVTDADQVAVAVAAAVERYGRLDAAIHNAVSVNSGTPAALESVTLDEWDDHASVSVAGAYTVAAACYPHVRRPGGSLVFMTSPAAIDGSAPRPLYGTTKAAQHAMVKSLAREWGPEGIRVNAILPLAQTRAMDAAFVADPTLEPKLRLLVPLHRIGDPERDIGPAAVFLCSDSARYVTGQTLVATGGRYTGL